MNLKDSDYQDLAKAIVSDFLAGHTSLRDGLVKVATDHQLNVNETRRVLEATNVHAHLSLFKEANDHKYVEFDVIDPVDVCNELFGRVEVPSKTSTQVKTAYYVADRYLDLPDERRTEQHVEAVKIAYATVPRTKRKAKRDKYAGATGYNAYALAQKVAEEMESRVLILHQECDEIHEKIASQYRSIYSEDFSDLQRDAFALHGADSVYTVYKVGQHLGIEVEPLTVKTASHYVVDKPVHRDVARAVKLAAEIKELATGIAWYRQKMGSFIHD